MPAILKPANLSLTWASGGDILNPGDTKYASGWAVEIPARQWFNYLDNRQDTAIAHLNQMGISMWDATTEYQWTALGAKSLVMGSNGTIYRTLTTNTNQNPTTTVGTHWEIAFANAGDFYTKTQSDALYLAKAANGSDISNTATFRTNLSVYSQAQTYTKTEVDAKTTVASTAQAQEWLSNTTLITPLRLAEAFQAANQSKATSGYQKIPGGIIVQWQHVDVTANTDTNFTFPIAFPNAVFITLGNKGYTAGSGTTAEVGVGFVSTTTGIIRSTTTGNHFVLSVGN